MFTNVCVYSIRADALQIADLREALNNIKRPGLANAIVERFRNKEPLTVDNLPAKATEEEEEEVTKSASGTSNAAAAA